MFDLDECFVCASWGGKYIRKLAKNNYTVPLNITQWRREKANEFLDSIRARISKVGNNVVRLYFTTPLWKCSMVEHSPVTRSVAGSISFTSPERWGWDLTTLCTSSAFKFSHYSCWNFADSQRTDFKTCTGKVDHPANILFPGPGLSGHAFYIHTPAILAPAEQAPPRGSDDIGVEPPNCNKRTNSALLAFWSKQPFCNHPLKPGWWPTKYLFYHILILYLCTPEINLIWLETCWHSTSYLHVKNIHWQTGVSRRPILPADMPKPTICVSMASRLLRHSNGTCESLLIRVAVNCFANCKIKLEEKLTKLTHHLSVSPQLLPSSALAAIQRSALIACSSNAFVQER